MTTNDELSATNRFPDRSLAAAIPEPDHRRLHPPGTPNTPAGSAPTPIPPRPPLPPRPLSGAPEPPCGQGISGARYASASSPAPSVAFGWMKFPFAGTVITSPRSRSSRIARRIVRYATPYSRARSRSAGSRWPGTRSPAATRAANVVGHLDLDVRRSLWVGLERRNAHAGNVRLHGSFPRGCRWSIDVAPCFPVRPVHDVDAHAEDRFYQPFAPKDLDRAGRRAEIFSRPHREPVAGSGPPGTFGALRRAGSPRRPEPLPECASAAARSRWACAPQPRLPAPA